MPDFSGLSLQDKYAPQGVCFGCGSANLEGLQLKSFVEGEGLISRWMPCQKYEAFGGILNGGIVGTLLDCHCNWTAAYHFMLSSGAQTPPCTVTGEYKITFVAPTLTDGPVDLHASVVKLGQRSATVEGTMSVNQEITAKCHAVFVSVKPGHPAYHRW